MKKDPEWDRGWTTDDLWTLSEWYRSSQGDGWRAVFGAKPERV